MNYSTILVEDDGPVRTIRLNRPDRRNAMTPQMQAELIQALEEGRADDCRVLILAGAGAAFCSGLDLSELQAMNDKSSAEHRLDTQRIATLFRTLYEYPKPTIAAVHGAAIAGGTGLALLCDFTLAVPEAKFGYTEVRIGFVPAILSAYLALQVGDKRARGLLLSGRLFDAEEAYRLGLVNEVVAADQLPLKVRELAELLMAKSPSSLVATKWLLAEQNKAWLDTAISYAMEASTQARESADFREGIAAFLEKRKPRWTSS